MPPRNAAIIAITGAICLVFYVKAMYIRPAEPIADALMLIDQRYIRDVPQRDLVDAAMRGLVSQLDPYSNFLPPTNASALQEELHQSFPGIGVMIEMPKGTERVQVISPIVGSPAQRAGMMAGDIIWQIGETDTKGLKMDEIRQLLRGPEGTKVDLQVKREGSEDLVKITVERAEIPIDSVVGFYRDENDKWVYRLRDYPQIAYVRISMFGERTSAEVNAVLTTLNNNFEAMIIDVRSNPGGLLNAAVEVCDYFLDGGVIVETRERGDRLVEVIEANPGKLVDPSKPLVILVNGDSASASEVMAACLQDHQRAVVAGSRSFGKGTVQEVLSLESGRSLLKLTTAGFFGPAGKKIHRDESDTEEQAWGVRPESDLLVEMSLDEQRALHQSWTLAAFPHAVLTEVPEVEGDADEDEEGVSELKGDNDSPAPPTSETPASEAPASDTPTPEAPAPDYQPAAMPLKQWKDFKDLQLQRAIEYLQKKIPAASLPVAA